MRCLLSVWRAADQTARRVSLPSVLTWCVSPVASTLATVCACCPSCMQRHPLASQQLPPV